jgi:hypothetical protein
MMRALGILLVALILALARASVSAAEVTPDAMETVVVHPHLEWPAIEGAERYRIQIARDDAFESLVDEDSVHAVIHRYVPARRLTPGDYLWRVRAETSVGGLEAWLPVRRLRIARPARTYKLTPEMPLEEVRRIAREAAEGPSACIEFAPGAYRWDPGFEGAVFRWEGASDILVEGNGAEIYLLDPSAQVFHLRRCRRIAIQDLCFHHLPVPYSAVEVNAVEPSGEWFEARVLAGFEEERYPREVNQFFVYAVSPESFARKHPDRPGHTYLAWARTLRVGEHSFRFHARDPVEKGSLAALRRGDRALVCYRRWPLNWVFSSRDIAWSGIRGGVSEGALFMGGDNQDMKFLHLVSGLRDGYFPATGGWVTGNDRRGPWIEGCVWEGLTDDGPNITANAYWIERVLPPEGLVVLTGPAYQGAEWLPGDELILWNPLSGSPVLETHIAGASGGPTGPMEIRVTDPLSGLSPGGDLLRNTHVYNLSTQNHGTVIRHNRIVGGRRFGFNVKAVGLLVEENEFQGLASSALYLENEPSGWEGLVSRDVVVERNRIVDCGTDAHSRFLGRAAIHVNTWRTIPLLAEADWIGNRNILIRRNTILDWEGIAIGVDNAERVRIVENTISSDAKTGFIGAENTAVKILERTRDVTLERNRITDRRPGYRPIEWADGRMGTESKDSTMKGRP